MGWYSTDVSYRVSDIEPWRADKSYLSGNYVSYKTTTYGGLYTAKLGVVVPVGIPPSDNSPYWELVVPGLTGATGSVGPQGPTGNTADGDAAFDQIATLITSLGLPFDPNDTLAFFNAVKLLSSMYGSGGGGSCAQLKDLLENKTTIDLATGQLTLDCDSDVQSIATPVILSPTNNAVLRSNVCVVEWSSADEQIVGFRITAGSSIGDATYGDSGSLGAGIRSYQLTGLPTDSSIIYLTFLYNTGTAWVTLRRQVIANDPTVPIQSYVEYNLASSSITVETVSAPTYASGNLSLTNGSETYMFTNGKLSIT